MSLLEVKHLNKGFGGLTVTKDFSLCVSKGTIHALIGPNGAGKTTLFNLISGLLEPSSGQILLEGVDITRMEADEIARLGLSRTFQISKLFFRLNVLENVLVGLHSSYRHGFWAHAIRMPGVKKEEIDNLRLVRELMTFVGLGGKEYISPESLTHADRRLLELARAIAACPKLLMLDEPAAGLNDTETARLISLLNAIKERQITILLIEHDMKFLMNVSDLVTVINQGIKIAEGTPQEIQHDDRVIEAYLGKGILVDCEAQ